jgi:hypothetical protein
MRNVNEDRWTELYQSDDLHQARVVATCLSAMEFDVRLCTAAAPYAVRVPIEDFSTLSEVLAEIIDEQAQFDQFMERWEQRSRKAERRLLIVMLVLVGGLGAVGAIDL